VNLALVALAAGLAVVAAVMLRERRRAVGRLLAAAQVLDGDMTVSGNDLGAATSLVERAVDRSVLRRGQASLSKRRLASVLEAIPQGIVVFDDDGDVVHRNEVAAGFLTARHGEALVEAAIAELAQGVAGGGGDEERTVELFGPPRRTVVLRAEALEEGGREVGVLVVIDDVTDRLRLEAVRRDFVANISHELKTPVGALSLLAETLLAEDDPAVVRRLTERMLAEADRVGRSIDDLLELSRIESSEVAPNEAVPVHLFVAEAVERVRPAAEQRGITIDTDEPSPRLVVAGDRRQLVSATFNLLDNAVKYSDAGSSVQVQARTNGRDVEVSVTDRGMGIPPRDLGRVFERFYRVDRARSRETGGTGLGLAIVRHVASNHAGDVTVTSREGEGSTFTLRLPVMSGPVAVTSEAG
jgi:two-component system sensor histidine kinase SenX3